MDRLILHESFQESWIIWHDCLFKLVRIQGSTLATFLSRIMPWSYMSIWQELLRFAMADSCQDSYHGLSWSDMSIWQELLRFAMADSCYGLPWSHMSIWQQLLRFAMVKNLVMVFHYHTCQLQYSFTIADSWSCHAWPDYTVMII